ncbi:SH3 domain-containing protein [Aminobacter sp. AP02]|uniref:SH3 domain-containing protein n=1 Tax=Aminobacter sp. AP02 TaxID=2135737 RepID=UPI000D6BE03C|nr:SH3 domain-containing protein [Aminobacter sp. AP02]
MPFGLGAANRSRSAMMFMKAEPASWRENAPNRGLVCGVLAMTALMSVTAVSALFIVPHMGQHSANTALDAQQAAAAPAKEKITAIAAEPTGRKERVATSRTSILVSDASAEEASDMPLAADPRWAQVVAAAANRPLEAMPAIPGAEKVVAADPVDSAPLALAETTRPDPAETAAVKAMEAEVKPAGQAGKGGREATIKRSVNMRAKPQKGGQVLGVIPAKTSVELVACTQWCEIVFNGKRGYVFKTYIQ